MLITVNRFVSDGNSTLSLVSIDGVFNCFGLEDEYRVVKVAGETRIPAGTYKVGLKKVGPTHAKYQNRFPNIHKGMLHILDVPDFTDILIHIGNTEVDTAGCLLVGWSAGAEKFRMSIGKSALAYSEFYSKVVDAAGDGTLKLEVIDGDRSMVSQERTKP